MSVKRIGLLALILAFGGSVEVLYRVRGHLDVGPWGVRLIGGQFFGPHFSFEQEQQEAATPTVEIRNAFGAIVTKPSEDDAVHVKLRKVVFLPDEAAAKAFADRVRLVVERDGDTLRIRTSREDVAREDSRTGFETHFDVELPKASRLVVRSEHGKVAIDDVRSVDAEASFDSIDISNVAETIRVKAQHGESRIQRVGGAVDIEARHGGVHAEDVEGALTVDSEHGDVGIERTGPVTARLAHADLEAQEIRGELTVRGSHSAVEAKQVTGNVDVETSFDPVTLEDVKGEVRVKGEHGKVRLASVQGKATVETKFGDLELDGVGGHVKFSQEGAGVIVKAARSGIDGRSVRGDVEAEAFAGPVGLEVEGAVTKLRPASPLADAIRVVSRRGDVELVVPRGSRFSLDARATRGEVHVDGVEAIAIEEGRAGAPTRARGEVGGGGASVTLETEGGSIHIETTGEGDKDR